MKRRQGFVSNSSSSSFICDVSGGVEGGYDLCLSEAEMYECANGHTFYEHYLVGSEADALLTYNIEWYKESGKNKTTVDFTGCDSEEKYEELTGECLHDDEFRYYVPVQHCPICSLSHVPDDLVLDYVTKVVGTSKEEYRKIIKDRFNSLDELKSFKG